MSENEGVEFVCPNGIKLFIPDEILKKSEFGELRFINKEKFKRQKLTQIEVPFNLSGFNSFHIMDLLKESTNDSFLFDVISGLNFFCPSLSAPWEFKYNGISIGPNKISEVYRYIDDFLLPPKSNVAQIFLKLPNGKIIQEEQSMTPEAFHHLISNVVGYEKIADQLIWSWAVKNEEFPFSIDVEEMNQFCSRFFYTECFGDFFAGMGHRLESRLPLLFEKQWVMKLNQSNYQRLVETLISIGDNLSCLETSSLNSQSLFPLTEISLNLIESILLMDHKQMKNIWYFFLKLKPNCDLTIKVIQRLLPYFSKLLDRTWFDDRKFLQFRQMINVLLTYQSNDVVANDILDFLFSVCSQFESKIMKLSRYDSSIIDIIVKSSLACQLFDKIMQFHHQRQEMPILFENLGHLLTNFYDNVVNVPKK